MKKATYLIEFESEDEFFRAGECWSCPYKNEEWSGDDIHISCHLGFDFDCKLTVVDIPKEDKLKTETEYKTCPDDYSFEIGI